MNLMHLLLKNGWVFFLLLCGAVRVVGTQENEG